MTRLTRPLDVVSTATPGGPLTVLVDGGTVVAAGFTDAATLAARLPGDVAERGYRGVDRGAVHTAVRAFAAGDVRALDTLPWTQRGTAFQQAVWNALREVPPGGTASYGELAAAVGRPNATRAVGSACGANLIAPIVPCHRAVRSDGSLGGYEYGLDAKRWLLAAERDAVDATP